MAATSTLAQEVGARAACEALGVPRASYYRHQRRRERPPQPAEHRRPPLALTAEEQQAILEILPAERFVDKAPQAIYATLLDEGIYHCSTRTMYPLFAREAEVRERRYQRRRTPYQKPELLATGPQSGLVVGHHQAERTGQVEL